MDMELCSGRCKLKEVVCPFGKCGDRVYKGCEKEGGVVSVIQKVMDD